jgi:hypothetical protein
MKKTFSFADQLFGNVKQIADGFEHATHHRDRIGVAALSRRNISEVRPLTRGQCNVRGMQ